jgi:PAS domain S-box-containing protein
MLEPDARRRPHADLARRLDERLPADRIVSEEQFRALAESSPAILWITDPAGACTFASRRWEESTGQDVAAAHGHGWLAAVHPEDEPRAREVVQGAARDRTGFSVDYRLRQAGGSHRWVVAIGQPHLGPGGAFLGLVCVVVDIDARKRSEILLRRTQQAARFLANVSMALTDLSDASSVLKKLASLAVPFLADWCAVDVITVPSDAGVGRLTVMHSETRKAAPAHELSTRWTPRLDDTAGPGRVLRTGVAELVEEVAHPERVAWVQDEVHGAALRELGMASYLAVPVHWGRQARAVLTLAVADPERRYEAGDLRVAEDLAQRASLAIENAELYQAVVEADRRKDEFLAVLSHELRTPLNAIVGWTHVLREGAGGPEIVQKAVDTIQRNALIQSELIAGILDMSRIVAGKLRLDVRSIELPAIIEAAVDTVRPAAQARRVSLQVILDPGAGPISGDASRLQQVVWNLLANAIKFVPERTGRVQVRLEAVNSHVRLTVADNGVGIDPAFLPHVFERFRQADSSHNRFHQGLGLGLSIVKHLVELHGGTVRADNRADGPGALFTVDLPRRIVAAVPAVALPVLMERHPRAAEPRTEGSREVSLEGVRVLVVDDHQDARDLLKAVLEHCGAEVDCARSVREAMASVPARPDVIVSDIEMPEESGYDFLKLLRALPEGEGGSVPVVALTAYATAHDRVKVLQAGFSMHLAKPVEPAELVTVVANLARIARNA